MKNAILLVLAFASSSVFAQEACVEGFACEKLADGQVILRETRLVRDESLLTCQVVTLANFGKNESACNQAAERGNQN